MRTLPTLAALPILLLATACATVPAAPSTPDYVPTVGGPDVAFGCGMRAINEMGYTVVDADRAAGFIRAERDRTGLGEALLGGTESFDVLTLTVFPSEGERTLLRVVAGAYEVQTRGDQTGARISRASSSRADQDRLTLYARCGLPESA